MKSSHNLCSDNPVWCVALDETRYANSLVEVNVCFGDIYGDLLGSELILTQWSADLIRAVLGFYVVGIVP
jgi:hypothetical protein